MEAKWKERWNKRAAIWKSQLYTLIPSDVMEECRQNAQAAVVVWGIVRRSQM